MPTIPIEDPADPRLEPYRNQKDAWLRARADPAGPATGLFIAEGLLVLEQLLRSDHETLSILSSQRQAHRLAPLSGLIDPAVPVYEAPQGVMDSIVGFHIHRGVLALGRQAHPPSSADLSRRCGPILVLEDLANHDNIGSVFRNAAALARPAPGVLLSPGCCDPLYRKALRVSLGHALRIPFARAAEWPADLDRLSGFTLIALTPAPEAMDIRELSGIDRPALLLGAEGPGLTPAAMERAAVRVRIPLNDGVDSLNVGVAAAIALHRLSPLSPPGSEQTPGPGR